MNTIPDKIVIIRRIGSFENNEANTNYVTIILTIDWNNYIVINKKIIQLGFF